MKRVKKFIYTKNGIERTLVTPGGKYYSTGPAPRTARGKRRHAGRSAQRAEHAKSVWAGEGGTL